MTGLEEERKYSLTRREYVTLSKKIKDKEQEAINPEKKTLIRLMDRVEKIYSNVKRPREAALDSQILLDLSDLGAIQLQKLNPSLNPQYSAEEFIPRLSLFLSSTSICGSSTPTSTESATQIDGGLNLKVLCPYIEKFFSIVPDVEFLNGPLGKAEPTKKKIIRERKEKTKGPLVKPVEGVIDDGNQVGSETSLRVQQVYKVLKREKDCEFYKLLLHPTSFSESVENIFHFSFLVQNGYAGIRWDEDDDGKMIAFDMGTKNSKSDQEKKQFIATLDFKKWKKAIADLSITTAMISRQPTKRITTSDQASSSSSSSRARSQQSKQKETQLEQQFSDEEEEEDDGDEPLPPSKRRKM